MPPTWPPFTRSTWDDRARSFLDSLSRMGREDDLYASVPMALNGSEGELERVRRLAVPSSLAAAGEVGADGKEDGSGGGEPGGKVRKGMISRTPSEESIKSIPRRFDLAHSQSTLAERSVRESP